MVTARLRLASCAAVALACSLPKAAHATDMSGLAVIVAGMVVGIPAAIVLLILIVVALATRKPPRSWHPRYGLAMMLAAPALGLAFPLSLLALGGADRMFELALFLNVPLGVLGLVAFALGWNLRRRR